MKTELYPPFSNSPYLEYHSRETRSGEVYRGKQKNRASEEALPSMRWWAMQDLNLRPHPCEGCALPLSQSPVCDGGDKGIRTPDLLTASQALSQLSYIPVLAVRGIPYHKPPAVQGSKTGNLPIGHFATIVRHRWASGRPSASERLPAGIAASGTSSSAKVAFPGSTSVPRALPIALRP